MHTRRRDVDLARDTSCVPHEERIAGRGRVIHDLSAVMGPCDFCDAGRKSRSSPPAIGAAISLISSGCDPSELRVHTVTSEPSAEKPSVRIRD